MSARSFFTMLWAVLLLAAPHVRVIRAERGDKGNSDPGEYAEYVADESESGVVMMGGGTGLGVGTAINNRHVRFTGSNCKGKPAPFHKVCWSERGIRRECRRDTKYGKLRCRWPLVRLWNYKLKKKVLVGICRLNTGGTLTHLCAARLCCLLMHVLPPYAGM